MINFNQAEVSTLKTKQVTISQEKYQLSYTSLINLCYKYLGYCLGVRRQESGVRRNKFDTIFYVVIYLFCRRWVE
ncbi:MAG: hypothetical protein F6K18_17965 [Okeania sp. SIO2C2]|uniref:hypothetical protein n=1 Tax=Okeania sp. SIO2C2 TaxID=2607787 RepID=UPI0013BE5328|nr:hypothetical protein [Okeania sp. SIO2C2]NEP88565.1 hypothetical protein [Okeania sp. SIO2C2]